MDNPKLVNQDRNVWLTIGCSGSTQLRFLEYPNSIYCGNGRLVAWLADGKHSTNTNKRLTILPKC